MRDIKNNVDAVQSVAPGAKTASADGSGVDLQGYDAAMVVFHSGTITDGTHTPKVEESNDNSAFTDVVSADLQGTLAAIASNTVQRAGYIGSKRYIRASTTVSGATSGGIYGALVVRGYPSAAPVA